MGKLARDFRFYPRAIGVDIPPEILVTVALKLGSALSVKKNSNFVGNASRKDRRNLMARYEGVVFFPSMNRYCCAIRQPLLCAVFRQVCYGMFLVAMMTVCTWQVCVVVPQRHLKGGRKRNNRDDMKV